MSKGPRWPRRAPLNLEDMGSFFFGGAVQTDDNGDEFHGDHGYVQYFIPERGRTLPLVMWHGLSQSGRTWETTPDGRDGFWQIFTRRGWPVYILDQPRRGRAGRSIPNHDKDGSTLPSQDAEAFAWSTFRLGSWIPPGPATLFPGVQFAKDPRAREQFLRQQTPSTGPEPHPNAAHREFLGGAGAALLDTVGNCVLLTHSRGAQYGWATAMRTETVQAIVALEPGEFPFPSDRLPPDVPTNNSMLRELMAPQPVSTDAFERLVRIPHLIVIGDNIADQPSAEFGAEVWRLARERARQFVTELNRRGGDATCLELPEVGIRGNTHFLMSDLNNVVVADRIENYLAERGLDGRSEPHLGPRVNRADERTARDENPRPEAGRMDVSRVVPLGDPGS